jgi:hypothetical protein
MNTLHGWVTKIATWRGVILLVVIASLCLGGFTWRQGQLGGHNILDTRFWYTEKDVDDLLTALKPSGRRLYAITQLTLDGVYPFAYGLLFGVLIVLLFPPVQARWLILLPLLAIILDLLENVATTLFAWDVLPLWLTPVAATFTASKWVFVGLSLLTVVVGGLGRVSTSLNRR